ncbi:hypothetical protein [Nocardioides terrisoli]|uniref:hypothetical protein n=1 Tax=Nocardioides terrisoli TaxID=3388267 RepID=UPI00287B968D|nr:hypothetical protein [Nocardioides marmorisolisilvae]
MVTCDFCGSTEPGEQPPVSWTSATEQGRLKLFCARCSREYLRSMEAKLDSDHW